MTSRNTTLLSLLFFAVIALHADPLYGGHSLEEYDFDNGVSPGWSRSETSTINNPFPVGPFLGPFQNESVSIRILDALPTGDGEFEDSRPRRVKLEFDLILQSVWDGNQSPSVFDVTANGDSLLHTTFATDGSLQAYPDDFPVGRLRAGPDQKPTSGALLTTYHIERRFRLDAEPDCCTDIVIDFSKQGPNASGTWRLDNVVVDWGQVVPEPSTFGLALMAALGLSARGHRRRLAENRTKRATRSTGC